MSDTSELRALRLVLRILGVVFIAGLFPLMQLWPAGFGWTPPQPEYEQMILATFAVLGVFLFLAARDPMQHLSLIRYAAWSSLVHGLVMLVQAMRDPSDRANLMGDVPALVIIGIVLLVLLPRASRPATGAS